MNFDRKVLELEGENAEDEPEEYTALIKFLRYHVLIPLKTMLFFESRSKKEKEEEEDKGRMSLSVAVIKLLIKLPLDIFLS